MRGNVKSGANEGAVVGKESVLNQRILTLRVCILVLLVALLVVPIALMNHDPEAVSEIDNRRLQTLPVFELETELNNDEITSFFSAVSGYASDRIGLRNEMIGAYSILNDELFGVMTHPSYEYGIDGWVFYRFSDEGYEEGYIAAFADYVLEMQTYCEDRGVKFLYVISPEKSRVYSEYIPEYVSDLPHSVDLLIPLLEERGINYVDQGIALIEAKEKGTLVFNKVYDAGHWNTEGMYAGSQAVVDALQEAGVSVSDIDISAYEKVYEEQTSLPASNYPISETTYKYEIMDDATNAAQQNDEFNSGLVMGDIYRTAHYYTSEQEAECSVLMFQGSYYNTQGTMLQNQFSTLATVHDYGNVFNLPYYFGIYRPDVVIFENADYTFSNSYYSYDDLISTSLPERLSCYSDWITINCNLPFSFKQEGDASIASFYFSWPDEVEGIDCSYVVADGVVYEATGEDGGQYLWGAQRNGLDNLNDVTVVGVDLDAGVKYQGTCSIVS